MLFVSAVISSHQFALPRILHSVDDVFELAGFEALLELRLQDLKIINNYFETDCS